MPMIEDFAGAFEDKTKGLGFDGDAHHDIIFLRFLAVGRVFFMKGFWPSWSVVLGRVGVVA